MPGSTIGPVKADPYLWPYDGAAPVARTALLCIDWQTDFCGPGGYVDSMGYDIALTRAGLPATQRLLSHVRDLGMLVIHTREGMIPTSPTYHPTSAGARHRSAPRSARPDRAAGSWSRASRAGRSCPRSRRRQVKW
ncbi:isochorismatase family protein [Phytohabitans flavus]|uniref:isochorismatase family protein n=1 Tax=Phytohabitans flavus TaxID=1076124 RepID=UPI003641943A